MGFGCTFDLHLYVSIIVCGNVREVEGSRGMGVEIAVLLRGWGAG